MVLCYYHCMENPFRRKQSPEAYIKAALAKHVEAYVTHEKNTYSAHNVPLPEAMHDEFGLFAPEITVSLVESTYTYTKVEVWGSVAWPDDTQAYKAFSIHAPSHRHEATVYRSHSPQAEASFAPILATETDFAVLNELLTNIDAMQSHEVPS